MNSIKHKICALASEYSAFIENSPEMREWLKSIGYINLSKCKDKYLLTYDDSNEVGSFDLDFILRAIREGRKIIDCRSNPFMFRAITAIRTDSDYKQWFKHESDLAFYEWVLCTDLEFKGSRRHVDTRDGEMIFDYVDKDCYQKATLPEIIKKYSNDMYKEKKIDINKLIKEDNKMNLHLSRLATAESGIEEKVKEAKEAIRDFLREKGNIDNVSHDIKFLASTHNTDGSVTTNVVNSIEYFQNEISLLLDNGTRFPEANINPTQTLSLLQIISRYVQDSYLSQNS